MLKQWYLNIQKIITVFFSFPVSAFAAAATFFLIISAFPFAMLLISLIGFIPGLETQMLQSELAGLMPDLFENFVNVIFDEIYAGGTAAVISIAALSALFSASKGFASLIRGMNLVYGIPEKRNYFLVRGMAILCTLGLIIAIVATLVVLAFGQSIIDGLTVYFPGLSNGIFLFIGFRILIIFLLLTGLFLVLYLAVPSRRSTVKMELPGAVFGAVGWILFSLLYSLYLHYVETYLYGSLTAAVFIMLWLYACIYILFVGAELNCYLQLKYPNLFRKKEKQPCSKK